MKKPTQLEVTVAAFLHDIGKLVQRAHGSRKNLPAAVLEFEHDILPVAPDGHVSHIHALGSEAFFHWMESEGLSLPGGMNRSTVRNLAVFHHKPDAVKREVGAGGWIVAESDRLASGQDRKPKDEAFEQESERKGWDAFIRTPLLNPFNDVKIDAAKGKAPRRFLPLGPLTPGAAGVPLGEPRLAEYPAEYRRLWQAFQQEFRSLCSNAESGLFTSALLATSERLLHAVPSSTKDQPDVSLHDHARATAAIAAALYRWHEGRGTLEDEAAIRDRSAAKFRLLAGDLSGIQSTLFRLAHQRVKGVNKILRARSFLMTMLVEGAALECEQSLGLSAMSRLQNAGGRFLLLVPAEDDIESKLQQVRGKIERWMLARWRGELGLNLALTRPFSGNELMREGFRDLQAVLGAAVEEAKQRAFATCYTAVQRGDRFDQGACSACGVRPALHVDGDDRRCQVCSDEQRLGADLPKLAAVTFREQGTTESDGSVRLWGDLRLCWHKSVPGVLAGTLTGFRVWPCDTGRDERLPLRYLGNYVPRLAEGEQAKAAYAGLSANADEVAPGGLKLFEQIAGDALEEREGELHGRRLLGVLKGDVDRLGAIFGQGLAQPSLGQLAGLSRRMDFFFSAQLPELLRSDARFGSTYMVYAGGDDLLLIGPWRQTVNLLPELRRQFALWTGDSPQITLSAALELTHPDEPLNRSAEGAERRLERAKREGRNRVCAISEETADWTRFEHDLENANRLLGYLQSGALSQAFVYRMLLLDEARLNIERYGRAGRHDPAWRAKWGYQLARNVMESRRLDDAVKQELVTFLNSLVGLESGAARRGPAPPARTAITVAVYRNRKA